MEIYINTKALTNALDKSKWHLRAAVEENPVHFGAADFKQWIHTA